MNLTVRAEELGDELRRLREAAGFSLERAGELIDASATKMSRIENGLREGSTEDVAALLAIYGCVGPRRTELLKLVKEVDRRGWWQRKPTFNERVGTLVNLEKKAELIVNFECTNVPGLLQLPEYTDALLRECELVPTDEVEHRVRARALRHSILLGPKPTRLLVLIDEQVLTRMIGSPAVMQRQLNHLAEAAARANISLQVLPNSGAHAGVNGAFMLLKRANGHKIVYLENLTSSLILEESEEINAYEKAIRLLVRRALPAEESLQVITELARRWEQGELA
ncbi:helix-turn-helix domain-containing protein [Lentzea nigeriaca]|uniref:helix-turn-helix domain-containing protein n=1 Tax=Lentzea nigeriaca TaxID=1128665 RepID=UPI00195B4673|nr:helix-turn-helix transcriptional regulator [Lentzea nigeriaca]MBM7860461.1 transcriptional regulator with XRE-family HTH domain [Lentzea nigeriaca]